MFLQTKLMRSNDPSNKLFCFFICTRLIDLVSFTEESYLVTPEGESSKTSVLICMTVFKEFLKVFVSSKSFKTARQKDLANDIR